MDRQAGFLLALLFLANFITIEADTAKHVLHGGLSNVYLGDSWYVECTGVQNISAVDWTRNGVSIKSEIDNQELTIINNGTKSRLEAKSAKSSHQGNYKCVSDSPFSQPLGVFSEEPPAPPESFDDIRVLLNGIPLSLICNGTAAGGPIQWYKDNSTITSSENIHIGDNGLNLTITKTVEASLGNYTCKYANSSAILSTYQVISKVPVKFASEDPPSVVEGEKLHLTCVTSKIYGPNITWIFRGKPYQHSEDRVRISKDENTGVEGAVLVVENMQMDEFGNVTCRVQFTKLGGSDPTDAITYVRVKDKLAALWPFLGICAEVIVLCAIILIYEKKRNKAELDDSDTDQSPDTKPTPNKDSEVRQRK